MIAQPILGKILLSKEILISEQARDRLTEMNIKSFGVNIKKYQN